MTIATEITRLQTAKGDIKAAIEAKGVTVAPELTLDAYPAKIAEITTGGGGGGEWTKPADWIDISTVADNEINLLVTEGSGFAFTCTVAGSGTFSVDWGDGTIDHNCASGAVQQHIHTTGGTPWTATGGNTWKVRVYNATATITKWKIARHTYTNRRQYSPLLWAVVGAQGLTDCSNMFYNTIGLGVWCTALKAVSITSFASCTNVSYMLTNCYGLSSLTLPSSWGSVINVSNMLTYCYGLSSLTLPASWGSVINVNNMLYSCYGLSSLTLPSSWGSVINVNNMLYSCYGLSSLTNFNYLGSTTTAADFTDALRDCENLQTPIVCGSLLSKFEAYGAAGYVLKIPSIRLTNAASTFTGSTPQINVSYTSLDATALENLFTDLPSLTGKTINITGCVGAASLTTTQREIATNKGWTIVG